MRTFPFAICFLACFNLFVRAQDVPTVKDETWGYSYTCKGLVPPDAETGSCTENYFEALAADFEAGGKESLQVHRAVNAKNSKAELTEQAQMLGGTITETSVGKLKAWKLRSNLGGTVLYTIITEAEPKEVAWEFSYSLSGTQAESNGKLADTALGTFTFLNDGDVPKSRPDLWVCAKLHFSIETVGFKGKVHLFPHARLSDRVFNPTSDPASPGEGIIQVDLFNEFGRTREACEKEYRGKYPGLDVKECEVSGRKAVKFQWVDADPGHYQNEELYVWDAESVWEIRVVVFHGNAVAKSALEEALNSFKLLQPATETKDPARPEK